MTSPKPACAKVLLIADVLGRRATSRGDSLARGLQTRTQTRSPEVRGATDVKADGATLALVAHRSAALAPQKKGVSNDYPSAEATACSSIPLVEACALQVNLQQPIPAGRNPIQ